MRIFRILLLVIAVFPMTLSIAHAATAYETLYTTFCSPLSSPGVCGCQMYWINRISEGRGKTESLNICIESCDYMFTKLSANHTTCKAACNDQRNNIDR